MPGGSVAAGTTECWTPSAAAVDTPPDTEVELKSGGNSSITMASMPSPSAASAALPRRTTCPGCGGMRCEATLIVTWHARNKNKHPTIA
eukprot:scaffold82141_cov28-Tisochrysis_lutea.AAC.3